jgi:tRNA nucleotidyltransferase (CCA-adding enzyme)
VYLAGGLVRDRLLGRPVRDVDVVVEGDALDFAERLAARLGAHVKLHGRFGTATLTLSSGERCDVAGTRSESYEGPGALPRVVAGASIEDDLARRDFSINAMAFEIAPGRRLVDPFGGLQDLVSGSIRMLHPRSALDDPTRAVRAARYAARLGFRIEPATRAWIAEAVRAQAFDAVSGDRLRREIALLLGEESRAGAVDRLGRLRVDGAISPALTAEGASGRIRRVEKMARGLGESPGWLCYLLSWMAEAEPGAVRRVADRLAMAGDEGRRVRAWPGVRRRLGRGIGARRPSEIGRRLSGLSRDEILAAAARLTLGDRRALLRSLDTRSRVALRVRGADLVARGIAPGPAIGRALARTLAARRDGRIRAAEELAYALEAAEAGQP